MNGSRALILLLIFVSVAVAATQSSLEQSAVPQLLPTPPPLGKLVDVGGYRVHLYCIGTGSPTVVIVGAGFSFDWGLVQPEIAKSTQVCTYDHSGIGWSDPDPKDSCSLRVAEVHNALKGIGIKGPYVLVGHSLGAVVARLYAGRYPDEVAGVVFVDHAFSGLPRSDEKALPPPPPPSKTPTLVAAGIESDPKFGKLSSLDRELHLWPMSQARNQAALLTNSEIMPQCVAEADAIASEHSHPLGDKPLIDVSTEEDTRLAGYANSPFPNPKPQTASPYAKLQAELLSLSRYSKQVIAESSGHFIIIDRPDVVSDAIIQVVQAVRNKTKL